MFLVEPKPSLWAFDPAAVDPQWYDFWRDCVVCVPAWELPSGNIDTNRPAPMLLQPNGQAEFLTTVTTPSWAVETYGTALSNAGNVTNSLLIGADANGLDRVPANGMTLLLVRVPIVSPATNGYHIGLLAGDNVEAYCPYTDGVVYFDYGGTASPNRITWSGYTFVAGAVDVFAFVAGTQGSAIYYNGSSVASQATAISHTRANNTFSLFTQSGAVSSDENHILFVAILAAEWTPGQVAAWAEDPFGPIRMAEMFPPTAIVVPPPPTPWLPASRTIIWRPELVMVPTYR